MVLHLTSKLTRVYNAADGVELGQQQPLASQLAVLESAVAAHCVWSYGCVELLATSEHRSMLMCYRWRESCLSAN